MHISFDQQAHAAYVTLLDEGEVAHTEVMDRNDAHIAFDYDQDKNLVGIEVME